MTEFIGPVFQPNKSKGRTYYIMPRFSMEPVYDIIEGSDHAMRSVAGAQPQLEARVMFRYTGEVFGVTSTTAKRWHREGVSLYQADEIAVKLGRHPTQLWPDWQTAEIESVKR